MNIRSASETAFVLELFQPHPNMLYSLDAAAHLAGTSRRSILIYCCAGLVRPIFQEPYGIMAFNENTIHKVRRIEHLRFERGIDLVWIKNLFTLMDEVDSLRSEVSFLRSR